MKKMLITAALCFTMPIQAIAAPVTPKAIKDANTTISYVNSVLSFLSDWYVTRYMVQNDASYHANINLDAKNAQYHQDEFKSPREWASESDIIQQLGGISPRNPPVTIGAENQRFFTTEFVALDHLVADMQAENDKMRQYFDNGLRLTNPVNKANAQNELARYDALLKQISAEKNKIYDRANLIGDSAEDITLSRHPLKNEILDMKKSMRLAEKIATDSQGDAANFAENLPELEALIAQLKTYSNKYANYQPFLNKNDLRMEGIRNDVKEYFEACPGFYKSFDELKANYNGDLYYQRPAKQRNLVESYKYLVNKYNEFVDANNH